MIDPARSLWRRAYALLALSLWLILVLYWTTAQSIVAQWSKNPLGHGYLVVAMSVYLLWSSRARLESSPPKPALAGVAVLAVMAVLWLLGELSTTGIVQQISLVGMVFGVAWCVLGGLAARTLIFPVTVLLFALPITDRVVPVLQDLTAHFAVTALRLTGVAVLLEGHVISIPGNSWRVAEACSGVNYLISSLAVGFVYAGIAYRYWRHRIGFVLAAALIPLLANGVRVFTTIFIASQGATSVAAGLGHDLFGWLVFAITMGLLFSICGRWIEDDPPASRSEARGGGSRQSDEARTSRRRLVTAATTAVLVISIAPLSVRWLEASSIVAPAATPPIVRAPWTVSSQLWQEWTPRFHAGGQQFAGSYERDGHVLRLHVTHYADANSGDVVTAPAALFDAQWWVRTETSRPVTMHGRPLRVHELHLQSPTASMVIWRWYVVGGALTGNDYVAKLLSARARILRSGRGSTAVVLGMRIGNEDPVPILTDFISCLTLGGN